MQKLRFANRSNQTLRLSVEPNPDFHNLAPGEAVDLSGEFETINEHIVVDYVLEKGNDTPLLVIYAEGEYRAVRASDSGKLKLPYTDYTGRT